MKIEDAFDDYHQAVFDFVSVSPAAPIWQRTPRKNASLALVRAPERFNPDRGTIKTYLFAIARNLVLKNYRDQRATEPIESSESLRTDPRSALEISSAVESAVAGLPHLQQEALVLFQYEGLTLEEIAQIVGTDVGTVKSRPASRPRASAKRIGVVSKSWRCSWNRLRRTS